MAMLLSSRYNNIQSLPSSYVFPPEQRPGEAIVPACKSIPVIDLRNVCDDDDYRTAVVHQILNACQEYGLFQVINHGVTDDLMYETMGVVKEFFEMPAEDKEVLYTENPKSCRVHTSHAYSSEQIHLWNDTLSHIVHNPDEHMNSWPEKPTKYREVVGRYSTEVRKMSFLILDLMSEGLGIEVDYLRQVNENQFMAAKHYPPCPDPSLALGVGRHCDPNLITILQQEVPGLQIFKDGHWIGVEAIPNAFVVNTCLALQIISNGKLKAGEHRAVTNTRVGRTSIVNFVSPSPDRLIGPAPAPAHAAAQGAGECIKSEDGGGSEPVLLYRAVEYREFLNAFKSNADKSGGALLPYLLTPPICMHDL